MTFGLEIYCYNSDFKFTYKNDDGFLVHVSKYPFTVPNTHIHSYPQQFHDIIFKNK